MSTSRRDFLKLFGIGATATVGASAGFSLFSHRESDFLVGSGPHLVFEEKAPLLNWDARAWYLRKDDEEIKRLTDAFGEESEYSPSVIQMRRSSSSRMKSRAVIPHGVVPDYSRAPWSPYGETITYLSSGVEGMDPMVGFYMAADAIREKIDADVQKFQKDLSKHSLTMITIVDCPIMAFPHREKGFYLETSISQFAAHGSDIVNKEEAISSHGEIPIDEPNPITMKYMLLMQEELLAMGMISNTRPRPGMRELNLALESAKRRV